MITVNPLVTVVCLSYNQEKFIRESLDSVLNQTYKNIQVLLVDDGSDDRSASILKEYQQKFTNAIFITHHQNTGNCVAFNKAFKKSEGKYIIDFSLDDIMLPDRIEKQVSFFESQPKEVGVIYTNSEYVDENGDHVRYHFSEEDEKPEGIIFKNLLARHIIEPSSMMIRKKVLDDLKGYDESLSYEDFDFWIRSSKSVQYAYLNEVLTKRRKSNQSYSTNFNLGKSAKLFHSTVAVCEKAYSLCQDEEEIDALEERVRYEMKFALRKRQFSSVIRYIQLLKQMNRIKLFDKVVNFFSKVFFLKSS